MIALPQWVCAQTPPSRPRPRQVHRFRNTRREPTASTGQWCGARILQCLPIAGSGQFPHGLPIPPAPASPGGKFSVNLCGPRPSGPEAGAKTLCPALRATPAAPRTQRKQASPPRGRAVIRCGAGALGAKWRPGRRGALSARGQRPSPPDQDPARRLLCPSPRLADTGTAKSQLVGLLDAPSGYPLLRGPPMRIPR